jgi:hypothetical protein
VGDARIIALCNSYAHGDDGNSGCYALKDLRDYDIAEIAQVVASLSFALDEANGQVRQVQRLLAEGLCDDDGNMIPLTVNSVDDERGGSGLYLELPDGYCIAKAVSHE